MGSDQVLKAFKPRQRKNARSALARRSITLATRRAVIALAILSFQSPLVSAQTPGCVIDIEAQIRQGVFNFEDPFCVEAVAPWTVMLHNRIGQVDFLIDGTALGILHMPQRDAVPVEDWPLPVALLPLSDHTWSVTDILDGKVLSSDDPMRYFLWTPGNSRNGWQPNGVDWGDAEARMFRCTRREDQEKCITYYPIPNCLGNDEPYGEIVLSVRRESAIGVAEMLDDYGVTDKIAHAIVRSTWAALCEQP